MNVHFDLTANAMSQTMKISSLIARLWESGDPAKLETVLAAFSVINGEEPPEEVISKARVIELWPHALDLAISCAHMHDADIPVSMPDFFSTTQGGL